MINEPSKQQLSIGIVTDGESWNFYCCSDVFYEGFLGLVKYKVITITSTSDVEGLLQHICQLLGNYSVPNLDRYLIIDSE